MEFDKVIKRICGDYEFTYGIIFGNEKIVFIKAGAGGDYRGYCDKYLKMAISAHKRMGATVICASNPINSVSTDRRAILKCVEMLGLSSFELYLVGVSDGAYLNLLLAKVLYDYLDSQDYYIAPVQKDSRSMMNVTFVTGDAELDKKFASEAGKAGLKNLKGHRSVGGMRASIYNAMPYDGVVALVEFMKKFAAENPKA